eukprot:954812-Prorocentrum_minimum.AAC.1
MNTSFAKSITGTMAQQMAQKKIELKDTLKELHTTVKGAEAIKAEKEAQMKTALNDRVNK